MTAAQILLLLHVLGAIAWVGSGMALLVLNRLLVRADDAAGLVAVGRQSQALGTRLFMPAALVTLGAGIALVVTDAAFGFTDLWILIGFAGIVASGIAQTAVVAPAATRLMAALPEHGLAHPDVTGDVRRVLVGDTLDVGALLVVVWAMVVKPGLL